MPGLLAPPRGWAHGHGGRVPPPGQHVFGGVVQAVSLDLFTVTGVMTNLER